jgi:hypothetical protein
MTRWRRRLAIGCGVLAIFAVISGAARNYRIGGSILPCEAEARKAIGDIHSEYFTGGNWNLSEVGRREEVRLQMQFAKATAEQSDFLSCQLRLFAFD